MATIALEKIKIDPNVQARAGLHEEIVTEYLEAMKEGQKFPPVTLFREGKGYWLADGFHRVEASRRTGALTVNALVKDGSRDDAIWCAAGANIEHGLRRSNADKRRAVELALRQHSDYSDRRIAGHCGVHHATVADVRDQVDKLSTSPQKRAGSDGKRYPAHPPTPPPEPSSDEQISESCMPKTPEKGAPGQGGPPPDLPEAFDQIGRRVPEALFPLWSRQNEVVQLKRHVSALRKAVRKAMEEKDELWAELNLSSLQALLAQVYQEVNQAMPYAVCPYCHGLKCRACAKRGFVSKFRWDTTCAKEMKDAVKQELAEDAKSS